MSTMSSPPVKLQIQESLVVIDNGIVQISLANPQGIVTGIQYGGIENMLEVANEKFNRGYWDVHWRDLPHGAATFQRIMGTSFKVILEDENQVEVSFTKTWDPSLKGTHVPLNIDKRFVMLRGSSGFYTYAIYEHLKGWADFSLGETRIVFKLRNRKFNYMAISDDRQRIMPMPEDRQPPRGKRLAYKEAVRLVDPINPDLKGEVDDKYQYSSANKDLKVHGWICSDPLVGFWVIIPSDEFRTGGPLKQNLTSHVGPTSLSVFISAHYAGLDLVPAFTNGEPWKKVFGPVFIYLNSGRGKADRRDLWNDAKSQMQIEVDSWPYTFPVSQDFPKSAQRGSVSGRLFVKDRYVSHDYIAADSAYVGLAPPGEAGSWQKECKGYQFWTKADSSGLFTIKNIRTGYYNLYAFVPGFIGDYKNDRIISVTEGCEMELGELVFKPPRDGPTLWEIGIPDRSAGEFFVPDPNPEYINKLFINHPADKFRQYGLWEKYADLHPDSDLVYTVGASDYKKDWFFAQVTRKMEEKKYQSTTWQIKFKLDTINQSSTYTLRVAIASATYSRLHVRFNDPKANPPHYASREIGRDNSIARHGIHGLYLLLNIAVPNTLLVEGDNTIFLTQVLSGSPFQGILYDYIRLEGPAGPHQYQCT